VSEDFWKADPLQLIGVGLIGVAAPIFFPALRPQFVALLKAGAKLALEAEFDADDALADRLVEIAVDALLQISPQDSEKDLCDRSETTVNRFLAASRASATRRGWDQQDVARRYDKRLVKFDHAVSRAHPRARPAQRTALDHASKFLRKHHVVSQRLADVPRAHPVHAAAKPEHPSERVQSAWTATRA
jgi:hypothetical protein